MTTAQQSRLDVTFQMQRLRLASTVTAAVASAWSVRHEDRAGAIDHAVRSVAAGQKLTVKLVTAYMAAKGLQEAGVAPRIALDPARYTTEALRGISASAVYARPFGAYGAFISDGAHPDDALRAAVSSVKKLAATDLQLAHTHAAHDWMQSAAEQQTTELRIVGYRRVLAGAGPHCALCEAASTRTYRVSDLLPVHEHCTCGVMPLYGTEPVASVGTSVRVELDPEIGPRLLADDWSSVGPRLIP